MKGLLLIYKLIILEKNQILLNFRDLDIIA